MNKFPIVKTMPLVGIVLWLCVLGLTSCVVTQTASRAEQARIEQAAHKVGVEPTIDGLAGYIVKSIDPGMSRDQVEQVLGVIAPFEVIRGKPRDTGRKWGPTTCDEISLELGPLPNQRWRIFACYDNNGKLVSLKSADSDFPPLSIFAD